MIFDTRTVHVLQLNNCPDMIGKRVQGAIEQ